MESGTERGTNGICNREWDKWNLEQREGQMDLEQKGEN